MNVNPKNSNMSFKDACMVAGVLTMARFFTVFMTLYSVGAIKADLFSFCYACVQFVGAGFFTDFILLTGLSKYYRNTKDKKVNGE